MKKAIFVFFGLLMLTALACNLTGGSDSVTPAGDQGSAEQVQPGQQSQPAGCPDCADCPTCPTPEPTPIPSQPVMINEGLNSLDSYVFAIRMKTTGSDPLEMSEMINETRRMNSLNATYTRMYQAESSVEYPELETDTSEIYRIGLESCEVSEGEYDFSTISPTEDELTGLLTGLADFNFVVSDQVLVGTETVNNISSYHYTFSVANLGVDSGVEVTANQGEYWIAVDGNYLVKYTLLVEMRSSADEAARLEFSAELTKVNEPIDISFPQGCLDDKANPSSDD
jgi:hypothetical protein